MRAVYQLILLTTGWAATAFAFELTTLLPSAVCSRRKMLGQFQKVVGGAACLVVAAAPPAAAAVPLLRSAARFDAKYTDMLHPGCDRRIEVAPTPTRGERGTTSFLVKFSGTDVGPEGLGQLVKIACTDETIDKYKLRSWSFEGRVSATGSDVDIDAGDGIHVGKWHASTEDQEWDGIRWADNNRWVVK